MSSFSPGPSLPVAVVLFFASTLTGQEVAADKAMRPAIRVVQLSGTPFDRGVAHGKAMKSEIQALVVRWKKDLRRSYNMDPDEFVRRFAKATSFDKAIEKWTPGLLDEVRGIAKGCGLPYETMYVWQMVDEVWAQGRSATRARTEKAGKRDKCTSIGVDRRANQPTIVAQNIDIPRWYGRSQTMLHIKEKGGLESFVVTIPGLVGANGLNSARVGIAVNTMLQLKPRRDGLPVAFVVRGLLRCDSWAKARTFLHEIDHASGQNYIIGGPDVAHSFECSANGVKHFVPFEGAKHTWHTNHPLRSVDWSPNYRVRSNRLGRSLVAPADRCPRFAELAVRLKAGTMVDLPLVIDVLSSKRARTPICNPSTWACTVMILGANPELRVSAGGAADHPLRVFRFAAAADVLPVGRRLR